MKGLEPNKDRVPQDATQVALSCFAIHLAAPERATDGDLLRDVSVSELVLNETFSF